MSAAIAELPEKPAVAAPEAKPPGEEAASFLESLNGDRGERKKLAAAPDKADEEKTKADKAATDKAQAAKDAKAKPAPAKKKATSPPPPPAEPDYEKIAEAAGRGVAEAIKKTESAKQAESDPLSVLSDDDRERHAAYVQMEKDYPQHYKGIGKKFLNSIKSADEWESQWLKDHPGEELDEKSAEYKAQEEKLSIDYDDLHFQKALARIEVEKLASELRSNKESESKAQQAQETERAVIPHVIAQRKQAVSDYLNEVGAADDLAAVIDDASNINDAEIKKRIEADPSKVFAFSALADVAGFTDELARLSNGASQFNKTNSAHSLIAKFVADHENSISQLTDDEQAVFIAGLPAALQAGKVGKRGVTAEQYTATPESKRHSYFRLYDRDIAHLYAIEKAEQVKELIVADEKRIDALSEKRGYKKVDAVSQATTAATVAATKPTPATPLPPSPSGAIEPRQALPANGGVPVKKNAADSFAALFGG